MDVRGSHTKTKTATEQNEVQRLAISMLLKCELVDNFNDLHDEHKSTSLLLKL